MMKGKEGATLRRAMAEVNAQVCQTLGEVLGYPWFKDDQKNFPGATKENGVCVGEHVAESIAVEAAHKIDDLRSKLTPAQAQTEWLGKVARDLHVLLIGVLYADEDAIVRAKIVVENLDLKAIPEDAAQAEIDTLFNKLISAQYAGEHLREALQILRLWFRWNDAFLREKADAECEPCNPRKVIREALTATSAGSVERVVEAAKHVIKLPFDEFNLPPVLYDRLLMLRTFLKALGGGG